VLSTHTWHRLRRTLVLTIAVLVALSSTPAPGIAGSDNDEGGVARVTGSFVLEDYEVALDSEPFAALLDYTTVFVAGPPLPESQVIGAVTADGSDYSFDLGLPIIPAGREYDVTGRGEGTQPQVFTVDVMSNVSGAPHVEEADVLDGWALLYSTLTYGDSPSGQLLAWSSGDGEEFPASVGGDGLALSEDDPLVELEPGWTLVEVTDSEYIFSREALSELSFASDVVSPNDLSGESWTDGFVALIDQLEAEYAFPDIKDIDFDELREVYLPLVERAEKMDDWDAYALAVYQFSLEFHDGHVASTTPYAWFGENYGGGYGLSLARADDGNVYVVSVRDGSAADDEGIAAGDAVTAWNGDPIDDAIEGFEVPVAESTEFARELEAVRWLTRGQINSTVEVTVETADGDESTVELSADEDLPGLVTTLGAANPPDSGSLPIQSEILASGVGYIRISTFWTDKVLFTHAWDLALRTFEDAGVTDLVVDVRSNLGGFTTLRAYVLASFAEESFTLADELLADGEGGFDPVSTLNVISGSRQWSGSVAVIIDADCVSACEAFAGAMAAIDRDDIVIVGETPSAGVYASIQAWDLPGDLYFQASWIRAEVDGEVWLEGQGVPPDVDVPVTRDSLLSPEDEVLEAAEEAVS
jgi:C-terminal processing protease CtpA/Prc